MRAQDCEDLVELKIKRGTVHKKSVVGGNCRQRAVGRRKRMQDEATRVGNIEDT